LSRVSGLIRAAGGDHAPTQFVRDGPSRFSGIVVGLDVDSESAAPSAALSERFGLGLLELPSRSDRLVIQVDLVTPVPLRAADAVTVAVLDFELEAAVCFDVVDRRV